MSYGIDEHQYTHCLKIMRPHSPGVGWVINASNHHEFSGETMVSNCHALQIEVAKEENLSEIFISLSVTQTRLC